MRIGIDMLGNQSPSSRKRGIGRYLRGLVSNLLAHHPRHEYFLYHHPGLTGLDDVWPGRPVVREIAPIKGDPTLRDTACRLVMEDPDRLDVYLVPSALECYRGFRPPPKPLDGPKMAVVVYDLIPALFQEDYLREQGFLRNYDWALRTIRQYDLLLAISESTRADCLRLLHVPSERVITIGAASDPAFFVPDFQRPPGAATIRRLAELGITEPYVFYLSGDDERKNHKSLVAAFGLLPPRLRETHQLVIACHFSRENERELRAAADRLGIAQRMVLSSYLPDETTRILYQQCAAFAFVSRYEGFGLPLLEALHCGAPVLAGRNSSQIEVVGDAGLLADVDDWNDVAQKLQVLLVDEPLAESLRQKGPVQAARFRWEATADQAAEALQRLAPNQAPRSSSKCPLRPTTRSKPRLAFFSPFLPKPSGISEYSANLLEVLREHYTIDLYHDAGYLPKVCHESNEFPCRDFRTFPRYQQALHYRRILYQMGNSEYHRFIYDTLLQFPGVVVLHDLFLANFHGWYAQQPGAPADHFMRELTASAPALAAEYGSSKADWEREPGGLIAACARREIMCNHRLLDAAQTVVVHDAWNEATIRRLHPDFQVRLQVVPHGASVREISPDAQRALRSAFELPPGALLFGCFGNLHPTKCNLETIEAFTALAGEHPSAMLIFVGRDLGFGAAWAKVEALGLAGRVRFFGHVSMNTFLDLVAVTDVGLNLRRPPTSGETSGSLQMLLAAGTPTIVSNVDILSAYPDQVVCKIDWDANFVTRLVAAMRALAGDPQRRLVLRRNAVEFIRETRDWRLVAKRYAQVIEQTQEAAVRSRAA